MNEFSSGEFNEHCLPNRDRLTQEIPVPIEIRMFRLIDQLFDERNDGHFETIPKKVISHRFAICLWHFDRFRSIFFPSLKLRFRLNGIFID